MKNRNRWLTMPLAAGVAAGLLSGCGSQQGSGAASGGGSVVMGMSDDILATDPASGYDPGSWLLFNNVFQSLLSFPKGSSTPEPEAAQACSFDRGGSTVYRCTLRPGLTFSNGDALTSEDVKYSFERVLKINDPSGPASMLTSLGKIDTPDAKSVVFHLKVPDATFPSKIASGGKLHRRPQGVPGRQAPHRRRGHRLRRLQAGLLQRQAGRLLGQLRLQGHRQGQELRPDHEALPR